MSDELAELFNLEVDEFNKKPKVNTAQSTAETGSSTQLLTDTGASYHWVKTRTVCVLCSLMALWCSRQFGKVEVGTRIETSFCSLLDNHLFLIH